MTNWMTAAGIALIAGGLATLIGFRRALWAGGGRRRPRAIEASRRRELTAASPAAVRALPAARRPELTAAPATDVRSFRHRRRKARVSGGVVTVAAADFTVNHQDEPVGRFGLASIGLAHDEAEHADARSAEAKYADVRDADVQYADVRDADAEYADAQRADAQRADAQYADVRDADVQYADVRDADAPGVAAAIDPEPAPDETAPAGRVESERENGPESERENAPDAAPEIDGVAPAGGDVEPDADESGHHSGDEYGQDGVRAGTYDDEGVEMDDRPGAQEEPAHRRIARAVLARSYDVHPELAGVDAAAVFGRIPSSDRPSDRVEDWVRPRYDDEETPNGDYWTPVPGAAYADLDRAPYGWPVPIERLPLVPPDHDHRDEPEPTGALPQWPPAQPSGRIERPRRWETNERRRPVTDERWARESEAHESEAHESGTGESGARQSWAAESWPGESGTDERWAGERWTDERGTDQRWADADQDGRDGWERGIDRTADRPDPQAENKTIENKRRRGRKRRGDDSTHAIPAVLENEPRRRPRPRPGPDGDAHSTVYRSRHAAEPS